MKRQFDLRPFVRHDKPRGRSGARHLKGASAGVGGGPLIATGNFHFGASTPFPRGRGTAGTRSTATSTRDLLCPLKVDSGRPVSASGHCRRGVALTMGATFTGFEIDCQYVVQLLQ
jgi:hypothetical protein